jgi:hypothetical protein
VETNIFNVLVISGFALMVGITGGVVYLTLAEWRDRRRQESEKQRRK